MSGSALGRRAFVAAWKKRVLQALARQEVEWRFTLSSDSGSWSRRGGHEAMIYRAHLHWNHTPLAPAAAATRHTCTPMRTHHQPGPACRKMHACVVQAGSAPRWARGNRQQARAALAHPRTHLQTQCNLHPGGSSAHAGVASQREQTLMLAMRCCCACSARCDGSPRAVHKQRQHPPTPAPQATVHACCHRIHELRVRMHMRIGRAVWGTRVGCWQAWLCSVRFGLLVLLLG
jgi:hypothetical protein